MKKIIAALILILSAASAFPQIYGNGESIKGKGDSVTGTNGIVTVYAGFAKSTYAYSTPSESAAVWQIIKTTYDANGVWTSTMNAYGAGQGDQSLWGNVWTNRYNATYK